MPVKCPFCGVEEDRILIQDDLAIGFMDGYPVAEGHSLVIPRRHVQSLFELPADEQARVWSMVTRLRTMLIERYRPGGFNIGINDGRASGQTVAHAHVHIIPRRAGDVSEPRGGIRWVLPRKAAYWKR